MEADKRPEIVDEVPPGEKAGNSVVVTIGSGSGANSFNSGTNESAAVVTTPPRSTSRKVVSGSRGATSFRSGGLDSAVVVDDNDGANSGTCMPPDSNDDNAACLGAKKPSGTLRRRASVVASVARNIYAAIMLILVPAYRKMASVFSTWLPSIAVRGMMNSQLKFIQSVVLALLGFTFGANIEPSDQVVSRLPRRCWPKAEDANNMQLFSFEAMVFAFVELGCCYLVRQLLSDGKRLDELPAKSRWVVRSVMLLSILSNVTSIAYTFRSLWVATELKVGSIACQTPQDMVAIGIGLLCFILVMVLYHVVAFGNVLLRNN